MAKVKVHTFDVKTGKRAVVERDMEFPAPPVEPERVDMLEVAKLLKHAKKEKWI